MDCAEVGRAWIFRQASTGDVDWSARGLLLVVAGLWLLASLGCGPAPGPEVEIRRLIAEAEQAAEARSLSRLSDLIADGYKDVEGRTRKDLVRYLAGYLLGHQSLHLFTHLVQMDISVPGRGDVVVLVAMAGSPLEEAKDLLRVKADLHRLELGLEKDNKGWKLIRAEWRRAEVGDFLF